MARGLGLKVERATGKLTGDLLPGGLCERWRDKPVSTFTKRDVREVTDEYLDRDQPYGALSTFRAVRRLLNWCVERDLIAVSPLHRVKPPFHGHERDRTLTPTEIRLFWRACERLDQPWRAVFQALLVTGQRRNEVARLATDELSHAGDMITLPGARTKNKREHLVPVSFLGREVIASAPRRSNQHVFSTTGLGPVKGLSKAKRALARLMDDELRRESGDPAATVAEFRLHDLRRTCATFLAELEVAPHVIDAILNHVSGTIKGVSRTYNKYRYLREKVAALELWGERLRTLVGGETVKGGGDAAARRPEPALVA